MKSEPDQNIADTGMRTTDLCELVINNSLSVNVRSHTEIWNNCKNSLKQNIPEPFFETFINNLTPASSHTNDLNLSLFADENMLPHLRDKYEEMIKHSLIQNGFMGQLSILSKDKISIHEKEHKNSDLKSDIPDYIPHPESSHTIEILKDFNFHETSIFIEGRSGTGKSHLGNLLLSYYLKKGLSAKYMSLESFILEYGASIQSKSVERWKTDLRNLDVLFIDDFQFIKKTATQSQEEIRKIVDHYKSGGKKIFLCSDLPLNKLPLREDLLSRLHTGRNLRLLVPDQKGRFQILKSECDKFNIPLAENEMNLIAARIRDDIRKLKSVPLRLIHRKQNGDLHSHISDLFTPGLPVHPSLILQIVSEHFKMPPEAITGPSRNRIHTLPRQIVAYLCAEMLQTKLSDIASLLNRKDHTSIIHLKKSLEKSIESDMFLSQEIRQIRYKIERNIY